MPDLAAERPGKRKYFQRRGAEEQRRRENQNSLRLYLSSRGILPRPGPHSGGNPNARVHCLQNLSAALHESLSVPPVAHAIHDEHVLSTFNVCMSTFSISAIGQIDRCPVHADHSRPAAP